MGSWHPELADCWLYATEIMQTENSGAGFWLKTKNKPKKARNVGSAGLVRKLAFITWLQAASSFPGKCFLYIRHVSEGDRGVKHPPKLRSVTWKWEVKDSASVQCLQTATGGQEGQLWVKQSSKWITSWLDSVCFHFERLSSCRRVKVFEGYSSCL